MSSRCLGHQPFTAFKVEVHMTSPTPTGEDDYVDVIVGGLMLARDAQVAEHMFAFQPSEFPERSLVGRSVLGFGGFWKRAETCGEVK